MDHPRLSAEGMFGHRTSVYAVTSLDAHQARPSELAAAIRGHWGVENSSHHIRDVAFARMSPPSTPEPRAMATLGNLAIGALEKPRSRHHRQNNPGDP